MVCTVNILKNAYGGDGLGRLGDGRVIFVPGAFKGEKVKAEIVAEKRGYVKSRMTEIVESSPHRTGAGPQPVPGMVYANIDRAGELEIKGEQLAEFFTRARFDAALVQTKGEAPSDMLHYRNKATYHFAKEKGEWLIGYMLEPEHRIMDVAEDPLARPEINAALPQIRRHVKMMLTQGAGKVRAEAASKQILTVRWSRASGVKWWLGDAPKDVTLKEMVCGKTFEVPAGGFWQVNPVAGEALVKAVVEEYSRGADNAPNVADLYCGVGVFGLCCAPENLVGVESGRAAVEFARRNAASLGAKNAVFYAKETAHAIRKLRLGADTTVILDPPRGGLERGVAGALLQSKVPRILYVSCDPATLVRDLKELSRAYDVKSAKWLDMFPRTARFETFVTLVRR